jgi:hypothetical protein
MPNARRHHAWRGHQSRYRIANGTIPDQLASLSPRFLPRELLDPFDGKPLRYKKDGNAYVVYSVGPDMADNGGAVRPSDARYDTPFDITFIVERSMR